jgi:hypothetical protein
VLSGGGGGGAELMGGPAEGAPPHPGAPLPWQAPWASGGAVSGGCGGGGPVLLPALLLNQARARTSPGMQGPGPAPGPPAGGLGGGGGAPIGSPAAQPGMPQPPPPRPVLDLSQAPAAAPPPGFPSPQAGAHALAPKGPEAPDGRRSTPPAARGGVAWAPSGASTVLDLEGLGVPPPQLP